MTERLAVVAMGFWHVHAPEYAAYAAEHPRTRLVAVWDDDIERGTEAARNLGVPFEPDMRRALALADAITLTSATTRHTEIALAAVDAGIHVFAEKLLAPTVAECTAILDRGAETGARVQVSLPRLYDGSTTTIVDTIASGVLGRISYARVRLSHHGATDGWLTDRFFDPAEAVGGALTDLGCHPVYLTQLFLGLDVSTVSATYGRLTQRRVEDNAVVTLGYEDGRIGVCETGFVTHADPFSIEVHGTDAALRFAEGDPTVTLTQPGGVHTPLPIAGDSTSAFDQWVDHIVAGTSATDNLTRAVALTDVVSAANDAASTGTTRHLNARLRHHL
ncbi:Gfo/Idh/MocA family oxidoreductase [Leifsonia shinshuensis]|uniref:Gfo/Idh/MocA family protein n=1 Tax=Leifsonia shinshuensis TaxID=150026 RepID=UPI001F512254|nr:Gfo/Idh/MocA family oxidoreductase [Leifsonia shinshuensis]MCI0157771.1 Gfo/Idh/MocA family oxidoreductase [Leifsonia shinshuensis]